MKNRIFGADRLEMLELHAQGWTAAALSVWFPYSRMVIVNMLTSEKGWRIGPDAAAEIRRRHAAGESCVALARAFKVHRNTIHRTLAGTTWAP